MLSRIEVISDLGAEDSTVRNRINDLGLPVAEVKVIDAYTLDGELGEPELQRLGYVDKGERRVLMPLSESGKQVVYIP